MLRTIPGLDVVGEASDGDAAALAVLEHRADVILMDVRMPGKDGIEATRTLRGMAPDCCGVGRTVLGEDGIEATRTIRVMAPDCRVLMLTMFDDDATVFTAMQAGAQGYLLKDAEQ